MESPLTSYDLRAVIDQLTRASTALAETERATRRRSTPGRRAAVSDHIDILSWFDGGELSAAGKVGVDVAEIYARVRERSVSLVATWPVAAKATE